MGVVSGSASAHSGELRQRLDKWLWYARVIKSRTGAARLVAEGCVRINSVRAEDPAKNVRPGDVLTIALDRQVKVLKVLAPGLRRGPFEEARLLYDDLSDRPGGTVQIL